MSGAADLGRRIADVPEGARLLRGVVVDGGEGFLAVSSSGSTIPVLWAAGWSPALGDPVRVVEFAGERLAFGLGAAPASPGTPGAVVQGPDAAPGPALAGTSRYPAVDSGYWSSADGWAGSVSYGSRLMQGTSAGTNTGAWFYGPGPGELAGRTIVAARVRVVRTDGYGPAEAAAAHLFAHTSTTRPAGNVTLTVPAGDATAPRGGADVFPVSVAAAEQVVAGGGLAISGGEHLVLDGVRERADSGLLEIDWRR